MPSCSASNNKIDTLIVNKDSVVSVLLPAKMGEGYSWKINSDLKNNIELITENQIQKNETVDGAEEIQEFIFKGLKPGKIEVNFIYVKPWIKPYPKNAKTKNIIFIIH